jgi:hypothetical protein
MIAAQKERLFANLRPGGRTLIDLAKNAKHAKYPLGELGGLCEKNKKGGFTDPPFLVIYNKRRSTAGTTGDYSPSGSTGVASGSVPIWV